ncbi:Sodium/hydrogen exchanger family-domain-containing protein [Mycena sp. CBHHK59/15]|nr:Sodium/hydrogen exchanger family-domain-containing protein [Mycena sp. CBHHK59/15]
MVAYTTPNLPLILTVTSFLYLINVAEFVFTRFVNAGLLGSLFVGILFGSQVSDILPEPIQSTFITLGYIGLLLIVYEAGLSTTISLLFDNILLSCTVALSGMILPVAISMLSLHYGFGYSPLQSFAAGASLSSTSLGTTLTVLKPEFRSNRTGTVLMTAALLDDIGGLVIASILSHLSSYGATSSSIPWYIVVRPILVSFGFAFGAPLLAFVARYMIKSGEFSQKYGLLAQKKQLFISVVTLSGFVAGAKYAGTSEFPLPRANHQRLLRHLKYSNTTSPRCFNALPIRSLGSVGGSQKVIWRGIIYSLLMGLAKAVVGIWMLIWPDGASRRSWFGRRLTVPHEAAPDDDHMHVGVEGEQVIPTQSIVERSPVVVFTSTRSAALVGFAMVARGEIALIVAEISRPLLGGSSGGTSEPFAVVIWATLLNTASGAILVGFLLRNRKGRNS